MVYIIYKTYKYMINRSKPGAYSEGNILVVGGGVEGKHSFLAD